VGCFVWDPDNWIKPESPFPGRIYFILSLPRFIEIFSSIQEIAQRLVWLPTWHQARLLCGSMGMDDDSLERSRHLARTKTATEELLNIYKIIIDALRNKCGDVDSYSA